MRTSGTASGMADTDVEIPTGRRHIIERPRLTSVLDATSARVIMLVAPAGYGKTTLARQWLANRPHAWYQASSASADVAALSLGLLEAAAALIPDVGSRLREWLPTADEPERDVGIIAELLSDDISAWPLEAWLGIDDYHLLATDAAEQLVNRLVSERRVKLLVTSRNRPAWVTARQLLYGEFSEVGPTALAMNSGEADSVLAAEERHASQSLVSLADGWPAVIGLAALSRADLSFDGEDLPAALHDYFAEELYASLTPETRLAVCHLALVPTITRASASHILGVSAGQVVQEATRVGFFVPRGSAEVELHPLLRAFLLRKLEDLPPQELAEAVSRTGTALIESKEWDDVFSLASRFDRFDLLDDLLASSLYELTSLGRLPTLRRWVDYGRAAGFESPLLDLADAELAFRQGLHAHAETLARDAAMLLGPEAPLASSAFCRAGQSRYFMDDGVAALDHFKTARETASNDSDARNALWGQFIVAVELEERDAPDLLREYESLGSRTRDSEVRAANGRLMLAIRTGRIRETLLEVAPMIALVKHATDPIVRSSFWHVYGAALMLSADYVGALGAVDLAVDEINSFYIDFARPHAYVNRVASHIGLKHFDQANVVLTEMEALAHERGDIYLTMNAMTLRCRLLLSEGSPDRALAATRASWPRVPSLSQQAEFMATRGAAFACTGNPKKALELIHHAEELSCQLEPRLLSDWARVLVLLAVEAPDAEEQVRRAFCETFRSGALDAFVFAYRLDERILAFLSTDADSHELLHDVLVRANDPVLAARLGLAHLVNGEGRAPNQLTPREQEVYALIAEGRTNREIACDLVISESTVKVHIRHILKKLQVRTRTEAAILASKTPLP